MIIDTHAHLMFEQFEGKVEEVIARAKAAGVEKIVNAGCGIESSRQSIEMADKYEGLYATVGCHPYDAADVTEELMAEWEKLINENKKIVAVGECGLDYVKAKVDPEIQKKAFRMQLQLAQRTGLPVIVHNRDADDDCLEILDEFSGNDEKPQIYAVFHCFGSNVEFARKVWYRRHLTSFTGIITYPNSEELLKVVDEVPMDSFMVETDCPYLAPQNYRGEQNEPAYVVDVVKKIAEMKGGASDDSVMRASTQNAQQFFLRMEG